MLYNLRNRCQCLMSVYIATINHSNKLSAKRHRRNTATSTRDKADIVPSSPTSWRLGASAPNITSQAREEHRGDAENHAGRVIREQNAWPISKLTMSRPSARPDESCDVIKSTAIYVSDISLSLSAIILSCEKACKNNRKAPAQYEKPALLLHITASYQKCKIILT